VFPQQARSTGEEATMKASAKCTWLLAAMAVASIAMIGCGGGTEEEELVDDAAIAPPPMDRAKLSKDRRVKAGIVTRHSRTLYSRGLYLGALKASREMADVSLYRSGTQKETDRVATARCMRDLHWQGVDTFIVAPVDSKSLVGEIKNVINRKDALVVIDIKVDCEGMVGTLIIDHRGAGAQAAEQLTGKLGARGTCCSCATSKA